MKTILTISLFFIGIIWIGCKKEASNPSVEEQIKIKRELLIDITDGDTTFSINYTYDNNGNLSSVLTVNEQTTELNTNVIYSNGRIQYVEYLLADMKDVYQYDGLMVTKYRELPSGEKTFYTDYYLDENYRAIKSVMRTTTDTLYYNWLEESLFGIIANDDSFVYNCTYLDILNPYEINYEYFKATCSSSKWFYQDLISSGVYIETRKIVKIEDNLPTVYDVYHHTNDSIRHYLEYVK